MLNENVSLIGIKLYFSFDAWKVIENVVKLLNDNGIWSSFIYKIALNSWNSVCCNDCLNWYHLKCVGLRQPPLKNDVVLPRVPSFGKIKAFFFYLALLWFNFAPCCMIMLFYSWWLKALSFDTLF